MNLQKNKQFLFIRKLFTLSVTFFLIFNLFSCSLKQDPVVIWTSINDFAIYTELFNSLHEDNKVIIVYKENPANSFPPAKDEEQPDIIVGPWLKTEQLRRYFLPLNYLFNDMDLKREQFYHQLLDIGYIDEKQYLLPICFNLPVVIFSQKNTEFLPDSYELSLYQIRDTCKAFNKKDKSGMYKAMGFAPSWNSEFLYTVSKLKKTDFKENESTLLWNESALQETVDYIKSWTSEINTSTTAEQDFKFKYLYTPEYKWITSNKCFFAYNTSNNFFSKTQEKIQNIDFRWIKEDEKIPIEDKIISIGLYKHSSNLNAASEFILWFMNEDNQKKMLEQTVNMNLITSKFGIADGFSSIKAVNEYVFPSYYPMLLGNLPSEESLSVPNILPAHWESLKNKVIIPYLTGSTNTDDTYTVTMQKLLDDWHKQYY